MTEVLFYHLTEHTLERALPNLLERSLERGWKVVIQSTRETHRDALDKHLWTYQAESFLPHSCEGEGDEISSDTPIWLTITTDNPIDAQVRFVVDDAVPKGTEGYDRLIYMFDGHDRDAVTAARERWKIEKEAGHDLAYWQQDVDGRWAKKA